MNGKKFTPKATGWKQSVFKAAIYDGKELSIGANNLETREFIGLSLQSTDSLRVGTYQLTRPLGAGAYSNNSTDYVTDSSNMEALTITRLASKPPRVVEGTFHFQDVSKKSEERVSVTKRSFRASF
ncbi:DUF6252 domain-containing protein [Spirosoma pomorum]